MCNDQRLGVCFGILRRNINLSLLLLLKERQKRLKHIQDLILEDIYRILFILLIEFLA